MSNICPFVSEMYSQKWVPERFLFNTSGSIRATVGKFWMYDSESKLSENGRKLDECFNFRVSDLFLKKFQIFENLKKNVRARFLLTLGDNPSYLILNSN